MEQYNQNKHIKELIQIISVKIGFLIPIDIKINIKNSNETNYTYMNKEFYIPKNTEQQLLNNTPEVDFSIAHEFCHMIQDFVYKSNINLHSFTKDKYQYELNKFFNTKDIVVTDEAYNKFKEFIKESPLFNDKMKEVMKFDDMFYISAKTIDSETNKQTGIGPRYIYYENTNEIYSNAFASKFVFKHYEDTNKTASLFQLLKDKINLHFKTFYMMNPVRPNNQFDLQIKLYKKQIVTYGRQAKHQLTINKLKGLCNYNHYDFQEASHEISKMINQVQTILDTIDLQYKTEEQQREVDKLKEEVKENIITRISQIDKEEKSNKLSLITFVDNFAPLEQDEGKYRIYTYADKDISHMHIDVANFTNHFTKELVIDMQNNKIYLFYYERTKTNEVANEVLSDNIRISNKSRTQFRMSEKDEIETDER